MEQKKSFFKSALKSRAFKLSIIFSFLLAVLILVCSLIFALLIRKAILNHQKSELYSTSEKIYECLESDNDINSLEIPYYIAYVVYDENSEVLYTNDPFLPILPESEKPVEYVSKNFFIDGDLFVLYCTLSKPNSIGNFKIQVSVTMDTDYGHKFLAGIPFLILLVFLPTLLISFVISFFMMRQTMRSVQKMTNIAKNVSSKNLDIKFEVSGSGDEFDNLAETFNSLFEKLKLDFEREKQFTSDVSHELKTPIAVIAGHANLIRRWGKNDSAQLEKSTERLISEAKSMELIVENLLKLSRLDSKRINLNLSDVNVLSLFERLRDDTVAWYPKIDFKFSFDDKNKKSKPENFEIFCDEELIYEALTIIVSNSIKYFDKDFLNINLCLKIDNNRPVISVSDNGPGIESEKLPFVFERFYRGDESHKRGEGGFGLGLAIVKSIMNVHSGTAEIFSDGKSGTTVNLFFKR